MPMPVAVLCPSCKSKLKAPDHLAGRTLTCPSCKSSVDVPAAVRERPQSRPVSPPARPEPEKDTKGCPFCGEDILAVAKKCKHCGEALDPTLRAAQEAARVPKRPRRDEDDEDDLDDDAPRGRRARRRRDDDEDDPRGPTVVVSNTLSNTVHVNAAFPHLLHIVLCVV